MPSQTYDATIWEIAACVEGFNRANNPDPRPEPPSDDWFDMMVTKHVHPTVQ